MTFDVDAFILEHASRPYDPVARRERYLRERRLMGRPAGVRSSPGPRSLGSSPRGPTIRSTQRPLSVEERRKRLANMKERLARLEELLRLRVEQAKARAGVKTEPKETEKSKETSKEKPEKKTAQEKREDAERSKEWREKNAPPQSVDAQIKAVQDQIRSVLQQLKQAADEGRNRSSRPNPRIETASGR